MWPFREKPTSRVKMVIFIFFFSEFCSLNPSNWIETTPKFSRWKLRLHVRLFWKKTYKFWKKKHKILKNTHNTYFRSYSILVPQPPVKVHCHHLFVFWAMIHQVLRFLSWKLQFEKNNYFKSLPNSNELKFSPYITEKITVTNNYTVTFTKNYL